MPSTTNETPRRVAATMSVTYEEAPPSPSGQEDSLSNINSLESRGSLIRIGFTPETATMLWRRYSDSPPDSPYDLLDCVKAHIQFECSLDTDPVLDRVASDRAIMTEIGFSEDFQARMLDPEFAGIMGSMELEYWLVDSVEGNYAGLERRLQQRDRDTARSSSRGR